MTQRLCELCATPQKATVLHHQSFILPHIDMENAYDVLSCPNCGFLYASTLASNHPDYYVNATHHLSASGIPLGLAKIHESFIDFIETHCEHLSHSSPILDVGASMGHFLNVFKRRGYNNLTGIEAAQNADRLAQKTYGIDVRCQLIDNFRPEIKYQLVTISGVLEHLTGLQEKIALLILLCQIT